VSFRGLYQRLLCIARIGLVLRTGRDVRSGRNYTVLALRRFREAILEYGTSVLPSVLADLGVDHDPVEEGCDDLLALLRC